jgi:pilus assembly protein Flp/PilA
MYTSLRLEQLKSWRKRQMNNLMLKMFVKMQTLLASEEGQDLVEYGLVVALVAFGSVVALQSIGKELGDLFSDINATLGNSI